MAAAARQRYVDQQASKAGDDPPVEWSGLVTIVSPHLEDAYAKGGTASAEDFDISPFDKLNERARDYASTRGAELVGMKYDEDGNLVVNPDAEMAITDTTRNDLRRVEAKAFEEGWSPDKLASVVEELIDDPDRAQLIADTDLAMAQQEGSLEEWKQSGVVSGKDWLLGSEHSTPDECDDNADAGTVPIDEDFPSGDDTSPAHPGCDCDVAAVVEGADE